MTHSYEQKQKISLIKRRNLAEFAATFRDFSINTRDPLRVKSLKV